MGDGTEALEALEALDGFFRARAGADGKMAVTFITYFASRDAFNRALDELSFVEMRDGRLHLPEGISVKAQVDKDKGGIPLLFLIGRFTGDQAREVVRVVSRHASKEANERHLYATAAQFADSLQERGGGGLVWTEWDYPAG